MPAKAPHFTKDTLEFILKASRQKNPEWLEKHREQYETLLLRPLQALAARLKTELGKKAPGYHFPLKGIGRLRRSAASAAEYGGLYKDWISYTATRPSESRFDRNPSLFFMINPKDKEGDEVLLAGGLYLPSSRQTKSIREAIATDASAFEKLFRDKKFAARFPGGFSEERISKRPPRGFDPQHPRIQWLKLQGYYVWRSYRPREYQSADFKGLVAHDCEQILRLNDLLDQAIQGRWTRVRELKSPSSEGISRLQDFDVPRREMDF
jgi:uncharacterized protein (TIGR02453 family)